MKKTIQCYAAVIFLATIFSCNGQKKSDPSKVEAPQVAQEAQEAQTVLPDPYFTSRKGASSAFGPENITRNIIEDKKGNLWFATYEGLIKYDGKTFTNFTNTGDLKAIRVFSLLEDSKGHIWIGTLGAGLYLYDGESFTNFSTADGLINDKIACIMEAKNGDLWIGTMEGVSKYDGTSFTNYTLPGGKYNNDINSIIEDKTGSLWLGTRGALRAYNGKVFTDVTNAEGKAFKNVRTVIKDKKGNLWFGGNDGLWHYDGSSFSNFTESFVGGIYQDSEENIWTGSEATGIPGNWVLSKYDTMAQQNKGTTKVELKTEENMFFGITEDKAGQIWFGTLRGVYRYDGRSFNDFKGY